MTTKNMIAKKERNFTEQVTVEDYSLPRLHSLILKKGGGKH
jgi:hypothetical protein